MVSDESPKTSHSFERNPICIFYIGGPTNGWREENSSVKAVHLAFHMRLDNPMHAQGSACIKRKNGALFDLLDGGKIF
jgi:hypothetical protein